MKKSRSSFQDFRKRTRTSMPKSWWDFLSGTTPKHETKSTLEPSKFSLPCVSYSWDLNHCRTRCGHGIFIIFNILPFFFVLEMNTTEYFPMEDLKDKRFLCLALNKLLVGLKGSMSLVELNKAELNILNFCLHQPVSSKMELQLNFCYFFPL